jgi:hypothetical protein
MGSHRDDLLRSIASTVADYRQGEIEPITPEHVDTWAKQFDMQDQMTVLAEMNSILKRYYFSRVRVKQWLHDLLLSDIMSDKLLMYAWERTLSLNTQQKITRTLLQNMRRKLAHIQFLNIQQKGESQKALRGLVNEVLEEGFNSCLADCEQESPDTYIYLDDGIYTGNRLRYDLTEPDDTNESGDVAAWIPRSAPERCNLKICTLAIHTSGFMYAGKYLLSAAEAKQMSPVDFATPAIIIENRRDQQVKFECLWPDRSTADVNDPDAGWYVKRTLWWCKKNDWSKSSLTRRPSVPAQETLFSSSAARKTIESAFFRAGARILKPSHQLGESRRPLGWEKLESWGFGTFFITYRNIANNCPMVLWSKAGGWYPLFPRKTNDESDEE